MITIKEAAIKTITNDKVLAKRIATFCTDNQITGFINGIPVDFTINVDKFVKSVDQPNIEIHKSFIADNGLCIAIDYEYDKIMFKNQNGNISGWEHDDYTEQTSKRQKNHLLIDLIDCEKFGIEVFFA